MIVVFVGLWLNNAWASGTVLRPFLQQESPLSSRSLVSGIKWKLRDSNSRPPYSRPHALTTIHKNVEYIPVFCFRYHFTCECRACVNDYPTHDLMSTEINNEVANALEDVTNDLKLCQTSKKEMELTVEKVILIFNEMDYLVIK